jgi:predicted HicB family RNase H-like nuclease
MAKKTRSKSQKPYWEMTARELEEATKEFDGPLDLSKTRPLTASERERFERATRGPIRSIRAGSANRKKTEKVTVELSAELVRRTTELAAERRITLDELVARSLQGALIVAR